MTSEQGVPQWYSPQLLLLAIYNFNTDVKWKNHKDCHTQIIKAYKNMS